MEIEGAIVTVCKNCSRLGKTIMASRESTTRHKRAITPLPKPPLAKPQTAQMVGFEITPDFARLVKEARERMNLTQKELGQKVGERTSTISLLERGKLKPSIPMARKLERTLKIVLLVPTEEGPE